VRRRGTVVTIGTFDGVHRGHQHILRRTVARARALHLTPVALTFHRPPRLHFFHEPLPHLITLLPEKIQLLRHFGMQRVIPLRFSQTLANMSPERFFKGYVLDRLNARELVVGYNFGFGKNRSGDTRLLERLSKVHHIVVRVVSPRCARDVPISSGEIRAFLSAGRLREARRLLGYDYFIHGQVVRGRGLGRQFGFPTANLKIDSTKILPPGVYAVRCWIGVRPGEDMSGSSYEGMCNIGTKPTVEKGRPHPPVTVEVHLLRYRGDLTGSWMRVEFRRYLRPEKPFASVAELIEQLKRDKGEVRKIFNRG